MPMLTTVRMRRPVAPVHSPTAPVAERRHAGQHLVHVGHDVVAVEHQARAGRQRSATWSTARCSVTLISLAGEHGVAPRLRRRPPPPRRAGRRDGRVDALLRQVDAQVAHGVDEVLGALGILGEQLRRLGGSPRSTRRAHAAAVVTSRGEAGRSGTATMPTRPPGGRSTAGQAGTGDQDRLVRAHVHLHRDEPHRPELRDHCDVGGVAPVAHGHPVALR